MNIYQKIIAAAVLALTLVGMPSAGAQAVGTTRALPVSTALSDMQVMRTAAAGAQTAQESTVQYSDLASFKSDGGREAAALLGTLGIVNGYPDGSFRPALTVTRAQMAKMVAISMTGGDGASFDFYDSAVFGDVDTSHWARKYIAYCYYNGVVAGHGNGRFEPDAPVTVGEASKMLLAALGYLPEREGLIGSAYLRNTQRLAGAQRLLVGLSGGVADSAPREDAAVLMQNGLYAYTVTYVGGTAVPRTETLASNEVITLARQGFDLLDVHAVLVATDTLGLGMYEKTALQDEYGTQRSYARAPEGQTRFVYRKATEGSDGGYAYTALTVRTPSDYSMLGRTYRLLVTRGADTAGVHRIYGAPLAANTSAVQVRSTAEMEPALVEQMPGWRTAQKNGEDPAHTEDGSAYINGRAVSLGTLRVALGQRSTASVRVVYDDGRPVYIFAVQYSLAYVYATDAQSVTLPGTNLGVIPRDRLVTEAGSESGTLAKGDDVAVWKNEAEGVWHVKKLARAVANVTGYRTSDDAYRIAGAYYQKGVLLRADDAGLMGEGLGAVRKTQFAYTLDTDGERRFIARVAVDEATKYDGYALFLWADIPQASYQQPTVKYMTQDGTVQYARAADVNGYTPTHAQFANSFTEGVVFSYAMDAQGGLHIRTAGNLSTGPDFVHMRTSGMLQDSVGGGLYDVRRGVLFVTYGQPASDGQERFRWKAYTGGAFAPAWSQADEAAHAANLLTSVEPSVSMPDRVIASPANGGYVVEAASVSFDDWVRFGYTLPGLAPAESERIAVVLGVEMRLENEKYVYTYTVAGANGTQTEQLTSIGFTAPYREVSRGHIYRMKLDSAGFVASLSAYEINTGSTGDGIEKAAYEVERLFKSSDGLYYLTAKKLIAVNGKPRLDVIELAVDPAQVQLYFVGGLFTPQAKMWDVASLPAPEVVLPDLSGVRVWLDYSEGTRRLRAAWVDNAPAEEYRDTILSGIVANEVRHDAMEGRWVYVFRDNAIASLSATGGVDSVFNVPAGEKLSLTFKNGVLSGAVYGQRVEMADVRAQYDQENKTLTLTDASGGTTQYALRADAVLYAESDVYAMDDEAFATLLAALGADYTKLILRYGGADGTVYSLILS